MKVGIVGLGLIGGSLAKAYQADNHEILALDINKNILDFAIMEGTVDEYLGKENIAECDTVLIAVTPENAVNFLEEYKKYFGKRQLVIDCCGNKKAVCEKGFSLAEKYGFTFVGGHPMAGKQFSGYKYSTPNLFKDATMALVPPKYDDIELFDKVKKALLPAKFGRYTIWSADEHDKTIAFTSQLAHIVSNAYMKSPTARSHKGLSAGSYKDLTRVAYLNASMWCELFMANSENVLYELDNIINSLSEYKNAIKECDSEKLTALLEEGSRLKQEVDKIDKSKS